MNIFRTSDCPIQSAQSLPCILVRKMLVEALQILSTAHVVLDAKQVAYKATHRNHPSCIWVRESKANYQWLFQHAKALCKEYTYRTGKIHASEQYLDVLSKAPVTCPCIPETDFKLAVPEEFKAKALSPKGLDVPKAYQLYLSHKFQEWRVRTDKRKIEATWTKRNKPTWYSE